MALSQLLRAEIAAFLHEHFTGYDLREAVRTLPHGPEIDADLPGPAAAEAELHEALLAMFEAGRLGRGFLEALIRLHPTSRANESLKGLAVRLESDQMGDDPADAAAAASTSTADSPEDALGPTSTLVPGVIEPDGAEPHTDPKARLATSPAASRGRPPALPVASAEAQARSLAFTGDVSPSRVDDTGGQPIVEALADALGTIQETAMRGTPAPDGIPTPALATLYLLVGPARPGHTPLGPALYAALRERAPLLADRAVFVLGQGVKVEDLPAGVTVDQRAPDAVLRNPGLAGVLSMGGDPEDPQLRSWWGIGRTLPLRLPWLNLGAGGGFSRLIAEQAWHSVYGPTVTTFSTATLRAALHDPKPSAAMLFACLRALLRHVSSFEPLRSDLDHFVADLAGRGGEQAVSDLTHLLERTDAAVSNHSKGAWVQRHAVTLVVAATAIVGIVALAFVEQGRVSAAQEQAFVEKNARESAEGTREEARTEATRSLPPPSTLEHFLAGSSPVPLGTPELLRLWNDPALVSTPAATGCDVAEWILPGPVERIPVGAPPAGTPPPAEGVGSGLPGSAALVKGLAVEVHTRLTVRRYTGTSAGSCRAAPLALTRAEAPARAFCVELPDQANANGAAILRVPQGGKAAIEVTSLNFHASTGAAWCAILTPELGAVGTEALPTAHPRATTPLVAPSRVVAPGGRYRWWVAVPPDGTHGDLHRLRLVTDRETPGASRLVLDPPETPGIPLTHPSDGDRATLAADLQVGLAALTSHCVENPDCGVAGQSALDTILAVWRTAPAAGAGDPLDRAQWMEPTRLPDREDDAVWAVAVSIPNGPASAGPTP